MRLFTCLVLGLAACVGCGPLARTPVAAGGAVPWQAPAADPAEIWVGLAFSGGGHRASAFGLGVVQELRAAGIGNSTTLADRVGFVAGVSGGAVLAATLALDGTAGLPAFRDIYLAGDAGRHMPPAVPGVAVAEDLAFGADPVATLGRALEADLFHGARYADLPGTVDLRLVASDVARAAPFVFDRATFAALCGDLDAQPVAAAVAASAAFPVVFSAVTLHPRGSCDRAEPPVLAAARTDPAAQPALRLLATTLADYADPQRSRPVRLLDGGMTDRYGTTGFLAARAEGGLSPASPDTAIRLRHILFVAVDAAQENWRITDDMLPTGRVVALTLYGLPQRLSAEGLAELDPLLSGRAITATTTGSFATLRDALTAWRQQIVDWRCGLDPESLAALYPDRPAAWDCADLTIHLAEVRIDALPAGLRAGMADIPTRLRLLPAQIDLAITAGGAGLRHLPVWRDFRRSLLGG